MLFSKIKKPFNDLSVQIRKETLCFQLNRYCTHKGSPVAVFHLNDPGSIMQDYVHDDGMIYLSPAIMKLISQLLKNAKVSENLQTYLEGVRVDLEERGKLPIPIISCFRTPPPELQLALKRDVNQRQRLLVKSLVMLCIRRFRATSLQDFL